MMRHSHPYIEGLWNFGIEKRPQFTLKWSCLLKDKRHSNCRVKFGCYAVQGPLSRGRVEGWSVWYQRGRNYGGGARAFPSSMLQPCNGMPTSFVICSAVSTQIRSYLLK